jgi:hypothetical protein
MLLRSRCGAVLAAGRRLSERKDATRLKLHSADARSFTVVPCALNAPRRRLRCVFVALLCAFVSLVSPCTLTCCCHCCALKVARERGTSLRRARTPHSPRALLPLHAVRGRLLRTPGVAAMLHVRTYFKKTSKGKVLKARARRRARMRVMALRRGSRSFCAAAAPLRSACEAAALSRMRCGSRPQRAACGARGCVRMAAGRAG